MMKIPRSVLQFAGKILIEVDERIDTNEGPLIILVV
jgi:hypothetical protein